MKLSYKQTKDFFRSARRRFELSNDFVRRNKTTMLKFIQYAIRPRVVLKRQLIRKRNRVFLYNNYFRKLIFATSKPKKRRHLQHLRSQWSKRLVMHLKRYSVVEFVEEDKTIAQTLLLEEDDGEKLNEPLGILKCCKQTIPLLESVNTLKKGENLTNSVMLCSDDMTYETNSLKSITSYSEHNFEELVVNREVALLTSFKTFPDIIDSKQTDKSNRNFLDRLISKVKCKTVKSCDNQSSSVLEKSVKLPNSYSPDSNAHEKGDTEHGEGEHSNSSIDFLGFGDNELVLENFYGMLSIPLARKRDSNLAFVSATVNTYLHDISPKSAVATTYLQQRSEDGQVLVKSIPPKLDMPALPEGLLGLRTINEKRFFLQRTKSIKYCIINNIGMVFHELQKRIKGHNIYGQAIKTLMTSSSVPMTRECWKAAAWLLTEMGNYYFQTLTVNGENFRLYGGQGNYCCKFKQPHLNHCSKVSSICSEICIDRMAFRWLKPIKRMEKRKDINKPCPLSKKVFKLLYDKKLVFSSVDIVHMPEVELEVFPNFQKTFSEVEKNITLPFDRIYRECAEFSVIALLERQKMKFSMNRLQSFTFSIPYAKNQNQIIIHRMHKHSKEFSALLDNSNLSFRKEIENRINIEAFDILAVDCTNTLIDMLKCVAISCSEDSFIKDDPEVIMREKTFGKAQMAAEISNKKPSRLLMELKRLNSTYIDASKYKSEKGAITCDKECCKFGCICASLNDGTTLKQHCGKQICVLERKCECSNVLHLDDGSRKITTDDAYMLRRQTITKLGRVKNEFTSTIVLTGSETLHLNEIQYDKKRCCTKFSKLYGNFVGPVNPYLIDTKPFKKKTEPNCSLNYPQEPVMVNDTIYKHLKHSLVKLKKLQDVKDLAPWCMIHMVYKCFCKGQATMGNPIIIEKKEEMLEKNTIKVLSPVIKKRILCSFDKEEYRKKSGCDSKLYETSETSEISVNSYELNFAFPVKEKTKVEKRGRISDIDCVEAYMNAKANHCRRVVPIPKNIYQRKNKKRVAQIQLYIAENESEETRLNLNEHVLRSVYYHQDTNGTKHRGTLTIRPEKKTNTKVLKLQNKDQSRNFNHTNQSKISNSSFSEDVYVKSGPIKKRRKSSAQVEERSSLLLLSQYKRNCGTSYGTKSLTEKYIPAPVKKSKIPKITNIYSLNAEKLKIGPEISSPKIQVIQPEIDPESASTIKIALLTKNDLCAHEASTDAFKNVFKQVIQNMNKLVSKKMHDIDLALRRESKAIPLPNAEILCILRWNNFFEAYMEGLIYLWEVQTTCLTFIVATIRPIMPLVKNALSVVNIQTILSENIPLLGRMLIDRKRSSSSECLAVVLQGQEFYWIVKGYLRPDKTHICAKPTPDSHPLLTRKINVLCRLFINNQFKVYNDTQDALQTPPSLSVLQSTIDSEQTDILCSQSSLHTSFKPIFSTHYDINLKLKVLPMQKIISHQATKLLEQLISQAYGLVRSNIMFRKIRYNELFEIFLPAKLNSNHHWHVLDIYNDFSHVFIPELKDVLTMNRIQKVMAYAFAKNRIVKMQFNQKSLFNVYVTPKSQRKLYFGPYRPGITAPKLFLLQSVDGQMMFREVYESKHNINPQIFRTTAFWVVQKSGRIFLDIDQDQISQVQIDERIIEKGSNAVLLNDIEIQSNSVSKIVKKCCLQQSTPHQENVQLTQNEQIHLSAQRSAGQHSALDPHDRQIEKPKEVRQISEVFSKHEFEDNTVNSTSINKNVCLDNFNKRNIIESESSTTFSPTIASLIFSAPISTPTHITSATCNADLEKNYKISYDKKKSSLVVVQNECDRVSSIKPGVIYNYFTIFETGEHSSSVRLPEMPHNQICGLQHNFKQSIPVNADFSLSSENCRSLKISNDINQPEKIMLTFPAYESSTKLSMSPEQRTNYCIPPTSTESNELIPSESQTIIELQSESAKSNSFSETVSQFNETSIKLNNHITIKKIKPDTGKKNHMSASSYKSSAMETDPGLKFFITPENQQKPPQVGQIIEHVQHKRNFLKRASPIILQRSKQFNNSMVCQVGQQTISQNMSGNTQQIQTQHLHSVGVRTPSVINTIVTGKQHIYFRNAAEKSSFTGTRLQIPAKISKLYRLPPIVSKTDVSNGTSKNVVKTAATKNIPHITQWEQEDILNRLVTTKQHVNLLQNKPKHIVSSAKAESSLSDFNKKQCDPLNISKTATKIVPYNLSLQKLQNGIKNVKEIEKQNQYHLQGKSPVDTITSVRDKKLNSSINLTQFRVQPVQKLNPKCILNLARNNLSINKLDLEVKNISAESPRLKPSYEKCGKIDSEMIASNLQTTTGSNSVLTTLDEPCKNKYFFNNAIASFSRATKTTLKMCSPASKTGLFKSTNTNVEYGYFEANIDGLPKFVVKRVGEDFLIKVPNFNGILKLTGLSTVYKYLSQYTTQKCSKTNNEILNLKWTFKAQDRFNLNNINKSNSNNIRSSHNTIFKRSNIFPLK